MYKVCLCTKNMHKWIPFHKLVFKECSVCAEASKVPSISTPVVESFLYSKMEMEKRERDIMKHYLLVNFCQNFETLKNSALMFWVFFFLDDKDEDALKSLSLYLIGPPVGLVIRHIYLLMQSLCSVTPFISMQNCINSSRSCTDDGRIGSLWKVSSQYVHKDSQRVRGLGSVAVRSMCENHV